MTISVQNAYDSSGESVVSVDLVSLARGNYGDVVQRIPVPLTAEMLVSVPAIPGSVRLPAMVQPVNLGQPYPCHSDCVSLKPKCSEAEQAMGAVHTAYAPRFMPQGEIDDQGRRARTPNRMVTPSRDCTCGNMHSMWSEVDIALSNTNASLQGIGAASLQGIALREEAHMGRALTLPEMYMLHQHLYNHNASYVLSDNAPGTVIEAIGRAAMRRAINNHAAAIAAALVRHVATYNERIAQRQRRTNLRTENATKKEKASLVSRLQPAPVEPMAHIKDGTSPARRHPDDDIPEDCDNRDEDGERCENTDDCEYCAYVEAENHGNNRGIKRGENHGVPFAAKKFDRVKRLVGVELECNQFPALNRWLTKWRGAIHSDGSCGWECVTTPIAGSHIDACITELTRSLRNQSITADQSCGIHVHVDATDVTWADMYRILDVYSRVEPILYIIAGQHRMVNQYSAACGPKYAAALREEDKKEAVIRAAYDLRANNPRNSKPGREKMRQGACKKDGGRYKGINILPWLCARDVKAPDCTIEFRLHRNSLDGKRVAGWAKMLAELVDWCTKATDADVANLPRSGLRALCQVVCPESHDYILKRVGEWRGVTTADRSQQTDAAGTTKPGRRITIRNGVYACAV